MIIAYLITIDNYIIYQPFITNFTAVWTIQYLNIVCRLWL